MPGSGCDDEGRIYSEGTKRPVLRVRSLGPDYGRQGGHGVAIQPLDDEGEPVGEPIRLTDTGAVALEGLLRQARNGLLSAGVVILSGIWCGL